MRNILFMAVFSLGLCSFKAEKISAWDFPLTLYPIAIKFDHGGANDAINIRKNYLTDITAPEYVASPAKNEKFAYVKGAAPTVKVKFYASPSDSTTSLTIDAFETVGDLNWNLEDTEMYFNMSADSSGYSIGDDQYVLLGYPFDSCILNI